LTHIKQQKVLLSRQGPWIYYTQFLLYPLNVKDI